MTEPALTVPEPAGPDPAWTDYAAVLLERELARSSPSGGKAGSDDRLADAHAALLAELEDGQLGTIFRMAQLEPVDLQVLALCAAVEQSRHLQRLVAELTRDQYSGRLDVDLLTRLLGADAVRALGHDGRLTRAALVQLEQGVPFAAAHLIVPARVSWALLEDPSLDPVLPAGTELIAAPIEEIGTQQLVMVTGEDRVRRVQAALRSAWGLGFLVGPPPTDDAGWQSLVRQATVSGLGIVLELDTVLSPLGRNWIERADHLAWGLCSREPLALEGLPRREFVEIEADPPEARDDEWRAVFPGTDPPGRRPTASQLQLARLVAPNSERPELAIRRVASGTLLRHARRITPRVGWDDLILPRDQAAQLHGLVDRYRQRSRVHDDWGLPLFPSPGVVALFSGPSGTGKTTTAEVIAGEVGVELFRVDLSALVSKYIGETEKNLEEIFSAAHSGGYLLLFDEADSIFGSRSKVTDAHDRYANMEVSYLLQRLETYDGFVVLTSNFQGNIDPAFMRRIHVTVHFPVPGAADRRRIWERSLAQAPTRDLDLEFVAERFDLAGGSIRNTALSAAFFAAAQDEPITMVHVLRALSQEFTKLGRRLTDDHFGRWRDDVTGLLG